MFVTTIKAITNIIVITTIMALIILISIITILYNKTIKEAIVTFSASAGSTATTEITVSTDILGHFSHF